MSATTPCAGTRLCRCGNRCVSTEMTLETSTWHVFPCGSGVQTSGLHEREQGRQAGSAWKGDYLIVRTCQQFINHTSTLYSVAAAAASPPVNTKGLTCGRSVLSPWPMHGYLHEQTLLSFIWDGEQMWNGLLSFNSNEFVRKPNVNT